MKKRTTAFLVIIAAVVGAIAGAYATGLFMKQYIIRIDSLGTVNQVLHLHRALRTADSGDLTKTQERLDTSLRSALMMLHIESDLSGCPSANQTVHDAEAYLEQRKLKSEHHAGG